MRGKVRLVGALAVLAVVLAACAPNATQDSLKPAGPYAEKIHALFTPVFWIAAGIFFVVEGAIVYLLLRYRHRPGRRGLPPQVHGNTRLEIAWTIAPALVLVVVAVPTVATLWDLARPPQGDVLNVRVVGHQWWWEFQYTDPQMQTAAGQPLTTGNELVIPVDRTVAVALEAEPAQQGVGQAVIHSFWVPQLAGTQDVVPGRTNHLLLQADEPGTYLGQCKEFCGLSHANMRFRVIALGRQDFDGWVRDQLQEAAAPSDPLAVKGMEIFAGGQCIACHAIGGLETSAGQPVAGRGGPDLTHFASRDCFAGCTFETNEENLRRWLDDPPSMKPGSWMPDYNLTEEQIDALVAYMLSLT